MTNQHHMVVNLVALDFRNKHKYSSNATSKDESFTSNSSNAQATDSVSERTHQLDDIPSFIRNREERRSRTRR